MLKKYGNSQAAASCNTYNPTKEQIASSTKLGTILTAEGYAIAVAPQLIYAAGAESGVGSAVVTGLGQAQVISDVYQAGDTAAYCTLNSTDEVCLQKGARTGISLGTLGISQYANTAKTALSIIANTTVSGTNLVVDTADVYVAFKDPNADSLTKVMSVVGVLGDVGGGIMDWNAGQIVGAPKIDTPSVSQIANVPDIAKPAIEPNDLSSALDSPVHIAEPETSIVKTGVPVVTKGVAIQNAEGQYLSTTGWSDLSSDAVIFSKSEASKLIAQESADWNIKPSSVVPAISSNYSVQITGEKISVPDFQKTPANSVAIFWNKNIVTPLNNLFTTKKTVVSLEELNAPKRNTANFQSEHEDMVAIASHVSDKATPDQKEKFDNIIRFIDDINSQTLITSEESLQKTFAQLELVRLSDQVQGKVDNTFQSQSDITKTEIVLNLSKDILLNNTDMSLEEINGLTEIDRISIANNVTDNIDSMTTWEKFKYTTDPIRGIKNASKETKIIMDSFTKWFDQTVTSPIYKIIFPTVN